MILTSSKVPLSLGVLQYRVAFLVNMEYFIAPVLAPIRVKFYLFRILVHIKRIFRNSVLVKATNRPMTVVRG
jgi:hypothetical protein